MKMNISHALNVANLIGTILQEGFQNICSQDNNLGLKPWPPQMFELLLFGSVAHGKSEVGDIDMMLLDNGLSYACWCCYWKAQWRDNPISRWRKALPSFFKTASGFREEGIWALLGSS